MLGPNGVQGVAGSNPAVPIRVSSFSPQSVIVAGNSSEFVKVASRYLYGMEGDRFIPGNLPALWRQRADYCISSATRTRRGSGCSPPEELEAYEFDFEYDESGRWVWQQRDSRRKYDTAQLAAFCIGLLLDHITGRDE